MNINRISEIQGVKFFDNPSSCISHFENTHWIEKAISLIQSLGQLLGHTLNKIRLVWYQVDARMNFLTKVNINELFKKRLVVCIHGLNNSPSQFEKVMDEIGEKDVSETTILIPCVLKKGNAELDEMVKPIIEQILMWAKTSEEKELVLVGISNGGRISRAIVAELAKIEGIENIKNLRFISIVGACRGSYLANLANKIGLSWLMSKNISEEMPTNSVRNQQLDQDWDKALNNGPTCECTFIASPHDWQVTSYDSSLMPVNKPNSRYAIIPGHGHNTIADAVAKTVAELIFT